MAKATATCTCATCGAMFTRTKICRNRRAAAASGCSISEYVEHALLAQLGGDTDA